MQRFDRYVLSQLITMFGFFALILVAIYWVNRAVKLLDQLIADGQSASVFVEFSLLWLPAVIAQVMPMASFAAAVYVANRLVQDSELIVARSLGYGPWRLMRPVLAFGLIMALFMSVLTHFLVPQSKGQLRLREGEIAASVTARLLREGTFLHPSRGVTFYIREITPEGELRDVLLSDRKEEGRGVIYTAERAYLVRDEGGGSLVMLEGLAQRLDLIERRLSTTSFSDLTYDISSLINPPQTRGRRLNAISTSELFATPDKVMQESGARPGALRYEAHMRFQSALICMAAAMVGYGALLVGGFSRFGSGGQILLAMFLIVCIKLAEGMITDPVRSNDAPSVLVYLPSAVGAGMVLVLLWLAGRGFTPRRGKRAAQVAT